jgi:hypothetical protein
MYLSSRFDSVDGEVVAAAAVVDNDEDDGSS